LNYTEGIIRNTEFFTTAELADKLKMNVQVITRKVQRARSERTRSARSGVSRNRQSMNGWRPMSTPTGPPRKKPSSITRTARPSSNGSPAEKRRHLLEYVLAQLEPSRLYTEKELDRVISRHFDDCPTTRQEFVERRMMELENGLYAAAPGIGSPTDLRRRVPAQPDEHAGEQAATNSGCTCAAGRLCGSFPLTAT